MIKFPYVTDYKLFERVEVREAEELLVEYGDFYLYNRSQYNDIFKKVDTVQDDVKIEDEKVLEVLYAAAEKNAKEATDHFTSLFGNKDFAESSFCGLRISWYDLQQILIEEFRDKTPARLSAMNQIAPALRNLASALLFAEYMHNKLERLHKEPASQKPADIEKVRENNEKVDAGIRHIKEWFIELLNRLANGAKGRLPEYNKSKNNLAKLRTVESIIEFCEKNLTV
ncbi:MAG: hypothetical protein FWE16_01965 [Firmicutes bacterium]|nr:hypothetical protein [Bacillota bacterium]